MKNNLVSDMSNGCMEAPILLRDNKDEVNTLGVHKLHIKLAFQEGS